MDCRHIPLSRWFQAGVLALAIALPTLPAHATYGSTGTPNFDTVGWKSLACDAQDLIAETSPSDINFVGTKTNSPAYVGYDSKYLYFRYRMDTNPDDWCGGLVKYSWTALLQVPGANREQFQYQLSVNGKTDTIELWKNTTATNITYTPFFVDDSELKLFTISMSKTGTLGNTKPLARVKSATTSYNGTKDYFVDFALPVSLLVSKGVISGAGDLASVSVLPATATNPNTHDRGHLNCGFLPEIECDQASDCNDGNACTTDSCSQGACVNSAIAQCTPCAQPSDCNDGNACTTESCTAGVCGRTTIPSCESCDQPSDCNDGNACTTETCTGGVCGHTAVPSCQSCSVAADCEDADACTTDVCNAGACGHVPAESCNGCGDDTECADENPCTINACGQDGSCQVTVIDGCVPCDTAADCNDDDECTTDVCGDSVCGHEAIANCPGEPSNPNEGPKVEVCDDGIDNDGNGLGDCADEDCIGTDACPVETSCGNCTDDDGDGLVDYEDPDCCAQTYSLVLRRMRLKMPSNAIDAMKIRTRVGIDKRVKLDPSADGATLQISDPNGQMYCHELPMPTYNQLKEKGRFRFNDKTGKLAGGLRRASFKIKKNGWVLFRARGKAMTMRTPEARDLRVTLRIGDQCMHTVAPLRSKSGGHTMLFP